MINVKKKTIMRKKKEFDVSDIESQNGKTIRRREKKQREKKKGKRKRR